MAGRCWRDEAMGAQKGDVCMPEIERRREDSFNWTRFCILFIDWKRMADPAKGQKIS